MPNEWRTIKSLVHKIRLHGRRGKGMAESFSREKISHAPQKEGGWKILCDLSPVWPRAGTSIDVQNEWEESTHTHTHLGIFFPFFLWGKIPVTEVRTHVPTSEGFEVINWTTGATGCVQYY